MHRMPKIVYIIPLHKKDDRVFDAIESVPKCDHTQIIVATMKNLKTWLNKGIDKMGRTNVSYILSEDDSGYPTLVNLGIDVVNEIHKDADLISILEFDDKLMPNAHKIVNEYFNAWDNIVPSVEIFAPLACVIKETDDEKPILIGVANEASIAPQVAEEYGLFDFNMMLRTNFIFVNGCYIRPSVFENYGKFKTNFKVFYDYEWALRIVYNGAIVRTIPKATHMHTLSDDGAFETQKSLPQKERDQWLVATRREYFFEDDRDIKFD